MGKRVFSVLCVKVLSICFCFFIEVNLYKTQLNILKITVKWCLVYSQYCAAISSL